MSVYLEDYPNLDVLLLKAAANSPNLAANSSLAEKQRLESALERLHDVLRSRIERGESSNFVKKKPQNCVQGSRLLAA